MSGDKTPKKLHFIPIKGSFSLLSSTKMGLLLQSQHPRGRKACMYSQKAKIFRNVNIRDIGNAYHRNSPS